MDIECTQRLECTQEVYDTQTEKEDPEQIGYLGICGAVYPVKMGPNKIGRDPKTCQIHLDSNSISRHHAVINVLNTHEFMLMDLDSSNKTQIQGKNLQPYVPHPLKNCDMVQFGDVFGVFRLFEDGNDLPMTQAIETPCSSVLKQTPTCGASVLVPESPEVSDRDDSFIMPSQPIISSNFKSPMNKFLKPSNKTIAIQPMGYKKTDNAYLQSRKKSDSFNFQLDDSGSNLDDSTSSSRFNKVIDESNDNIHEMETQEPYKATESIDSIYTTNTQKPLSPSIHCMETQQPLLEIHDLETQQPEDIHIMKTQNIHNCETQAPTNDHSPEVSKINDQEHDQFDLPKYGKENRENDKGMIKTQNIHSCETQAPTNEHSPEVSKINDQEHVQYDLPTDNKENYNSIYNAETQVFSTEKGDVTVDAKQLEHCNMSGLEPLKEINDSDEEILFDEINSQSVDDVFESQPLLSADISPHIDKIEKIKVSVKGVRLESGSPTDCEDFGNLPRQKLTIDMEILPTQKIINDIDILPTQIITNDDDLTDCEDDFANEVTEPRVSPEVNFEDMATQVLGDDEIEMDKDKDETDNTRKSISFEDMPTQILTDDSKDIHFEDMPTQIITEEDQNDNEKAPNDEIYSEEIVSPFKVPFPTPLKAKKKSKMGLPRPPTPKPVETKKVDVDDPNYYAATQDILNDLCSQRELSPESNKQELLKSTELVDNDEIVPSSVEDYQMGDRFRHIEDELSPVKNAACDHDIKAMSTASDLDLITKTPKTLKIINADLPDSQEIKVSVTLNHKSITESSSDTEAEEVSDQDSGITFRNKKLSKKNAKIDLTKRFEESCPTRIITRVRKPTYKIQHSDESTKNKCKSILKNTILADGEDNIDTEIINENMSRLKSKSDKKREKDETILKTQSDESKKRPTQRPGSRNENRKTDRSIEETEREKESKRKCSRSKTKKSEETKSNNESHDESKDEKKVRSTRNSRNKKENVSKDNKAKHDRDNDRESKETDRSNRSRTRHDSKENKTKDTSKSKEKDENQKPHVKTESSPDIEIRRSKRQKTKDNKERPKHENSTVYCLSSDSSTESPKLLKRPASNDLEVPSSKRTRSLPNSKSSSVCTSSNASLFSTPVRADVQHVLFTAFSNDDVRGKLENLGAVLVTDVMACTVLVTLQIKRTFKLLCAVGLGRPIVGPEWVKACADTNTIVDPWQYVIKDVAAEQRFRFSLENTLKGKRNFLKGFNVTSTPGVLPNAQEMKLIVECSGGAWQGEGGKWVCVSCSADKALWPALRRRGATVVSTEFILGGVLRQAADLAATVLGVATNKKKEEFVCEECGRRCLSRIGLSSHTKAHTRS